MLISAYTATRPGALVYMARNVKECKSYPIGDEDEGIEADEMGNDENMEVSEKDEDDIEMDSENENNETENKMARAFPARLDEKEPVKTICYEDVKLLLLPNPTGTRDLLALEVDLRYTKGHQRQIKR
jgi:hypothetical protein